MVLRIFTPSFLLFPLFWWMESHYYTLAFASPEHHNFRHSAPKRVLHVINLLPPRRDENTRDRTNDFSKEDYFHDSRRQILRSFSYSYNVENQGGSSNSSVVTLGTANVTKEHTSFEAAMPITAPIRDGSSLPYSEASLVTNKHFSSSSFVQQTSKATAASVVIAGTVVLLASVLIVIARCRKK
jgi:hypothetical protein